MKVADPTHPKLRDIVNPQASKTGGRPASVPKGAFRADHVELSDAARNAQAVQTREEMHTRARVEELRQAIDSGRYNVDTEALADDIIRDEVLPWITRKP
jgi:flagellar biosynthesis anti-sigma factor FlgM